LYNLLESLEKANFGVNNFMDTLNRGIRDAFRNSIRTFGIVLILAVAIAMTLVMFMALKTVESKIESVKSSIGNYVTVSPAGIHGFEGGGELLTSSDIDSIKTMSNVKGVTSTLNDRLRNGDDTNLESAIEPGSFGNRQQERSGDSSSGNTSQNENNNPNGQPQGEFKMPVMVVGTDDLSITASLNVSELNITSGEKFDAASEEAVAMIGTKLAEKNNLSVGSTFQAYGQNVKVVGIFDGGNDFANNSVVMPIKTLQKLSAQEGQINSIIVEATSIDSVSTLETDIKSKLGNKADVVSQQDSSNQAIQPLENIKSISFYSLIGALISGSIILFLTMLMVVRERKREIGVLKAIGSSNAGIMAQFSVEALVLTITSSVVGIIIGVFMSNPVLNMLVKNAATGGEGPLGRPGQGGAGMMMRFGEGMMSGARNVLNNLSATVGWEIILYGLLAAIVIAIIGSAVPAYIIAKVRPAEAMRAE